MLPHLFPAAHTIPLRETSLFHAFTEQSFSEWCLGSQPAHTAQQTLRREVWGPRVWGLHLLAWPCFLRWRGSRTQHESWALASGSSGASILPSGSGKECGLHESQGRLCNVGDSEGHVLTLQAMMTLLKMAGGRGKVKEKEWGELKPK